MSRGAEKPKWEPFKLSKSFVSTENMKQKRRGTLDSVEKRQIFRKKNRTVPSVPYNFEYTVKL